MLNFIMGVVTGIPLEFDLMARLSPSGPHTLSVGIAWWVSGMTLAVGCVVLVYSHFRGKADSIVEEHQHRGHYP